MGSKSPASAASLFLYLFLFVHLSSTIHLFSMLCFVRNFTFPFSSCSSSLFAFRSILKVQCLLSLVYNLLLIFLFSIIRDFYDIISHLFFSLCFPVCTPFQSCIIFIDKSLCNNHFLKHNIRI